MPRRRGGAGGTEVHHPTADLFAGMMVALLLVLVILWLQALLEAVQMRRVRETALIFEAAFAQLVEEKQEGVGVDDKTGEITLDEEVRFAPLEWKKVVSDDQGLRDARTLIARVLLRIEEGFQNSEAAKEMHPEHYVEILVIGHADCRSVPGDFALRNNIDLSALRAATITEFLTRPCQGTDGWVCCPDGDNSSCRSGCECSIASKWTVLPVGRGELEPRNHPDYPELEYPLADLKKECSEGDFPGPLLDFQRRVAVQIVPRMDKLLIRAGPMRSKSADPPSSPTPE